MLPRGERIGRGKERRETNRRLRVYSAKKEMTRKIWKENVRPA